jgi:hypothetical protein
MKMTETSDLVPRDDLALSPKLSSPAGWKPESLDDYKQICEWIARSGIAPRGFDSPAKVFIGLQTAMEAGLPMLGGLRMLYIVNRIPTWTGAGALALIRSKGVCDQPPELRYEGEGKTRRAIWRVKRKDMKKPVEVDYSMADAIKAGLDRKEGSWQTATDDMLGWRGVARLGKRYFSDILLGLSIAEEVQDWPPEAFAQATSETLPTGEPPEVADPIMVGAGAGAPAQAEDPRPVEPAQPAPTSAEPEPVEGNGGGVMIECPRCEMTHLYGPASDYLCVSCGCDVRDIPPEEPGAEGEPMGGEEVPTLPCTLPQLRKMLKRVGIIISQKGAKEWTETECIEAYNWAFDEQLALDAQEAGVDYERTHPNRPSFLPEPKREQTAPPSPVPPTPQEESQPSPYSTPGGSCITTREAGVLRGMAQNRCTELGLKEPDARLTFVMDALGCAAEQVTTDMYELAKLCLKEHTPEF